MAATDRRKEISKRKRENVSRTEANRRETKTEPEQSTVLIENEILENGQPTLLYGDGDGAQFSVLLSEFFFFLYFTPSSIVQRKSAQILLCFHLLCLDTSKRKGKKESGEKVWCISIKTQAKH